MKNVKLIVGLMVLSLMLDHIVVNAQSVGIAADKQKQEQLEKVKKRRAELRKKYNSMTPEQAADFRRRANEYKRSGGKTIPVRTTSTSTSPTKNTNSPAATKKVPVVKKTGSAPASNAGATPVVKNIKGVSNSAATTRVTKSAPKSAPATQIKGTYTKKKSANSKVVPKGAKSTANTHSNPRMK